jgi:hypothetical protein
MNIDPLSNSNINPFSRRQTSFRDQSAEAAGASSDQLSAERSQSVRDALGALPEVRPEVVARGRELLADPSYPGQSIIQKIASLITPLPEY